MISASGMSLNTEKPSISKKPTFFWASFSLTFWDFFPAPLALEFPLAVRCGVVMLLGPMLLNLLGLLNLLQVIIRLASHWRVSSRDLNALSVS